MIKRENGYPEEQCALIIMDTFKGQDNDRLRELCSENYCKVVIVPHNLTNQFQPLDISVNKAAKVFIQNMYNEWFSNEVAKQLNRGFDPAEVKITSKLSDLKPLLASWIADLYEHLEKETEMIKKGFDSARITGLLIMLNLFTRKLKILFEVPKLCFLIKKKSSILNLHCSFFFFLFFFYSFHLTTPKA